MRIFGIVLAGGEARRMSGAEKCLLEISGKPILAHLIARLSPQVERLALSANGDSARFAEFNLAVLADRPSPLGEGPLAGVLAGLEWAAAEKADALLSVPGDTPFLPASLVDRLAEPLKDDGIRCAVASSGGQIHPVISLWKMECRAPLGQALARGERKVRAVQAMLGAVEVAFEIGGHDPFRGVNTPEDFAALRNYPAD